MYELIHAESIERLQSGWAVRLRCGARQHPRFRILLDDKRAASERAARMGALARLLVESGKATEAPLVLRKAGEQSTDAGMEEVEAFARELCGVARPEDAGSVTFRQLAERWASGELSRQYPDHVRKKKQPGDDHGRLAILYPAIGDVPLREFTLAHAKRGLAAIPDGRLPATRRHYAQLISRVLSLAAWPCEIVERSPLPRGFLPRPGKRPAFDYLRPSEDRQLLACQAVPFDARLLYGVLAREGLRLGEAEGLLWRHVDLEHGVLRLDANKTDTPRAWALSEGVARTLRVLSTGKSPDDPVFVKVRGSARNSAQLFRDHLEVAGITRPALFERNEHRRPIRIHDLRATFITVSLAMDRTEAWICDRTGHRSSQMVNTYRRAARTAAELGLGDLLPLDQCLPELANGTPGGVPGGVPFWRWAEFRPRGNHQQFSICARERT